MGPWRRCIVVVGSVASAVVTAGCGEDAAPVVEAQAAVPAAVASTTPSIIPDTQEAPPMLAPEPEPEREPELEPEPEFSAVVHETTAEELGVSWRPDCPVPVEDLRRLELTHWTNAMGDRDGAADTTVTGELVIHVDHVEAVMSVFERLFEARFPIQSLRPISEFDGDDEASMAANNSSGFNCRVVDGTSRWSRHAYGGAIDLNPLVNPWVRGDRVDPPEGAPYLDRSAAGPGLIRAGDAVTEAFAAIGWGWGGDWDATLDYQHFSHDGR